MEQFPRSESLNTDYIQMKALQVLYDFHALRFPDKHPSQIYSPFEGRLVDSPEAIMLLDATALTKAEHVKLMLQPVLRALCERGKPENVYEALISYCDQQVSEHDRVVLAGSPDSPHVAEELLPSPDVIDDLVQKWVYGKGHRSAQLEQHVADIDSGAITTKNRRG